MWLFPVRVLLKSFVDCPHRLHVGVLRPFSPGVKGCNAASVVASVSTGIAVTCSIFLAIDAKISPTSVSSSNHF